MKDMPKERFKVVSAAYLVLRDGDKVLLSLRQNTGWMDGTYTMVSGHIEADEKPTEAMVREAKEEAGIDVQPEDLRVVHVGVRQRSETGDDTYIDFYMECPRWQGELRNMEPEKCGGLDWFPASELPANILPYLRDVIGCIERGELYSEIVRQR